MEPLALPIDLAIAPDHPAFAGHFPGQPIVPGVVLLDLSLRALQARGVPVGGLASAKFLSPATPGEALTLHATPAADGVAFEIRCGARRIAQGRFTSVAAGSA